MDEYFCGGETRKAALTAFFTELRDRGATLCVLTRGEAAALHKVRRQAAARKVLSLAVSIQDEV